MHNSIIHFLCSALASLLTLLHNLLRSTAASAARAGSHCKLGPNGRERGALLPPHMVTTPRKESCLPPEQDAGPGSRAEDVHRQPPTCFLTNTPEIEEGHAALKGHAPDSQPSPQLVASQTRRVMRHECTLPSLLGTMPDGCDAPGAPPTEKLPNSPQEVAKTAFEKGEALDLALLQDLLIVSSDQCAPATAVEAKVEPTPFFPTTKECGDHMATESEDAAMQDVFADQAHREVLLQEGFRPTCFQPFEDQALDLKDGFFQEPLDDSAPAWSEATERTKFLFTHDWSDDEFWDSDPSLPSLDDSGTQQAEGSPRRCHLMATRREISRPEAATSGAATLTPEEGRNVTFDRDTFIERSHTRSGRTFDPTPPRLNISTEPEEEKSPPRPEAAPTAAGHAAPPRQTLTTQPPPAERHRM